MSDDDTASVAWFVDGYRRALARFISTATPKHDAKERFIPLFEALNWAVATTDLLSAQGRGINDATVRGLRFARNRVHHQWADALEARHLQIRSRPLTPAGRGRPMIYNPLFVVDWVWKPLDSLPEADPKHRHGAAEYRDHLAGKPVRASLEHLDALLQGDGN